MLDDDLKKLVDMPKLDLILYIDSLEARIHDRDVIINQMQNRTYNSAECCCHNN